MKNSNTSNDLEELCSLLEELGPSYHVTMGVEPEFTKDRKISCCLYKHDDVGIIKPHIRVYGHDINDAARLFLNAVRKQT